jgi:hypothetical protein
VKLGFYILSGAGTLLCDAKVSPLELLALGSSTSSRFRAIVGKEEGKEEALGISPHSQEPAKPWLTACLLSFASMTAIGTLGSR